MVAILSETTIAISKRDIPFHKGERIWAKKLACKNFF